MFEIMRDTFDKIGGASFVTGIILSVSRWFNNIDYSLAVDLLTVCSLSIGIVYFVMKIYHQYLETKRFKRENERED